MQRSPSAIWLGPTLTATLAILVLAGCQPVESGTPVGNVPTPAATPTVTIITGLSTSSELAATPTTAVIAAFTPAQINAGVGMTGTLAATATPGPAEGLDDTDALTTTEGAAAAGGNFIGLSAELGAVGGSYQLKSIRVGEHPDEGFTRIVWEMEGTGGSEPHVQVIEKTGDGEVGAEIELTFTDLSTLGAATAADTADSMVVQGVMLSKAMAATLDDSKSIFAVKLAKPARFKIVGLVDPTRVVLDVFP